MARIEVIDETDPPEDPSSGKRKHDDDASTTPSPSSSPAPSVTATTTTQRDNPNKKKGRKRTKKVKKGGEHGLEEQPPASAADVESSSALSIPQAGTLGPTRDSLVKKFSDLAMTPAKFEKTSRMLLNKLERARKQRNRDSLANRRPTRYDLESMTDSDSIQDRTEPHGQYQNLGNDLLTALQLKPSPSQRVIGGKRFKRKRQEVVVRTQDMEGYRGGDDTSYNIDKILEFVESKEVPVVVADDVKKGKTRGQKKRKKRQEAKKKQDGALSSPSVQIEVDPGTMNEGPPPPDTQESELHVLAEKAGFKVNVQYDEVDLDEVSVNPDGGGGDVNVKVKEKLDDGHVQKIEEKGNQESYPLQEQRSDQEIVRVLTDSGASVELLLIGFTFPKDDGATLTDFDQREAVDWMNKRAVQLKRLARKGKITSKFV
ncbi:unnamed protein product [Orchesella dallaii]|uniref:Uncharacterized protein n=1 Tax=Orchesella dallaii TaxID=48710 RepID=A0ABP1R7W6_9HEXA